MTRTRLPGRRPTRGDLKTSALASADFLPAALGAHWFLLNNKESKLVLKGCTGSFLVCVSGISPAHTSENYQEA